MFCLFPEGAISRNGHLGKFHSGYERTLQGIEEGVIVPFYLRGLWGSSLSRADEGLRNARTPDIRRDLIVAFGKPLPLATNTKQLKQKIFDLSYCRLAVLQRTVGSYPYWRGYARQNATPLTTACGIPEVAVLVIDKQSLQWPAWPLP